MYIIGFLVCAHARARRGLPVSHLTLHLPPGRARVAPVGQPDVAITRPTPDFDTERNHQMARKTRPVHCWGIVKRDFVEIKGFGDCRVLSNPKRLSEDFDIIQFWVKTPCCQLYHVSLPEDSYLNVVEFIDDDDEEFTEEIERVMICELRKGDKFYFGRKLVTYLGRTGIGRHGVKSMTGREFNNMKLSSFMVVKRVRKVRVLKTRPLSFTEFALSSYERALSRLVEAVSRLHLDPTRVEVQKPIKKAENARIITAEDVPFPAPVAPKNETRACKCDEECDRSYCIEPTEPRITVKEMDLSDIERGEVFGVESDNIQTGHYDDHVLTCSDVIAELEEVRLHEGDLPVSIMNPENSFRRVNVSGSMLEDLYPGDEAYWGSRTWDTQPRPGNPAKSELVVSLW